MESRRLVWVLGLNVLGMVAEAIGGILSGSISLLSDAGHMFTDSFALFISLGAIWIAKNPPCHHRTYGLFRAEILAAFINSFFLFLASAYFIYQSVSRILEPIPVRGLQMLVVGIAGLAVNLVSMVILRVHRHHDLNTRSAFLHMLADTLSSVAVVAGAVVIRLTGMTLVDPLIGIGISLVILFWSWGLFRESSRILLEMAPRGLDVDSLAGELKARFPEIEDLSNVHFWAITSEMYVFTAHIRLHEVGMSPTSGGELIGRVNSYLKERHPIVESTIQWVP